MKALLCREFGPISNLAIADVVEPNPGPQQVVIEVHSAALNFPDALIVQGLYQIKPPLPFSPGAELAGIVKTVGSEVKHLRPGDRVLAVTGHGGLAQACLADADQCMHLPDTLDFDTGAALVLTYGTSFHALRHCANLQAGETLLVLGASGGVGIAAIELAKAMGARVIAAASTTEKLAVCKEVGADELINYETEKLKERVMALTHNLGADVVYDAVGGKHSETALRSTGWRGRFLVVGFASGEIPRIPLNLALLSERQILGVFWHTAALRDPKNHLANMQILQAWLAEGKIRPRITERLPLDKAADAIARIAQRKTIGKIVINP